MHSSLISATELQAQLGRHIVVLDCRFNLSDKQQGNQLYRQGHIPNAVYFDLEKDLSSPIQIRGGRHPLPDIQLLQQKLRRAGVSQHTPLVIYDDSRMAYAARTWWLLKYMGHSNVRILNGGFRAWLAINGKLDRREPDAKSGNFTAAIVDGCTVDRNDILSNKQLVLIDAREARRFKGLEEPIDPIAGSIPNAVNYFWQDITDDQGFIKPLEWQASHWESLIDTENLVSYCGSGVTACVNIFSLYLCGRDAKLYPGSWSDWCSYLPLPNTIE